MHCNEEINDQGWQKGKERKMSRYFPRPPKVKMGVMHIKKVPFTGYVNTTFFSGEIGKMIFSEIAVVINLTAYFFHIYIVF